MQLSMQCLIDRAERRKHSAQYARQRRLAQLRKVRLASAWEAYDLAYSRLPPDRRLSEDSKAEDVRLWADDVALAYEYIRESHDALQRFRLSDEERRKLEIELADAEAALAYALFIKTHYGTERQATEWRH
ncbi:MAG: hypothetical protein ACR2OV_18105 [Hyphomicrobiaceae bacterium]